MSKQSRHVYKSFYLSCSNGEVRFNFTLEPRQKDLILDWRIRVGQPNFVIRVDEQQPPFTHSYRLSLWKPGYVLSPFSIRPRRPAIAEADSPQKAVVLRQGEDTNFHSFSVAIQLPTFAMGRSTFAVGESGVYSLTSGMVREIVRPIVCHRFRRPSCGIYLPSSNFPAGERFQKNVGMNPEDEQSSHRRRDVDL